MPSVHTKTEPLLTEEDKKEVIAAVAKECGFALEADDPVFALVFLHDRVLGRSLERLAEGVRRHLVLRLERALQGQVDDMGTALAKRTHDELQSLSKVFREVEERVDARGRRWSWAIVSTGASLLLVFGLMALGLLP